jgi:hypothetical protein
MAVTFIIGNSHGFPRSMFDSGSTIASTVANEFAEATGDMHSSALIGARLPAVRHHLCGAGHSPPAPRLATEKPLMSRRIAAASIANKRLHLRSAVIATVDRARCALALILWSALPARASAGSTLMIFTHDRARPPVPVGGLRNAIVGSIIMCAIGHDDRPGTVGILAGTWLAEYGAGVRATATWSSAFSTTC